MNWRWIWRLFLTEREDRWDADLVFVGLGVGIGGYVGRRYDSTLAAIGIALVILAAREVIFHRFVNPRRRKQIRAS